MEQLETYCSGDYLEMIHNQVNRPLQEMLLDGSLLWIAELYKLLHGHCLLITDLSDEEILRRSTDQGSPDYNPNFRRLWKSGKKYFISYPETFEQMKKDEQYFEGKSSELFLVPDTKIPAEEISWRYGLISTSGLEMQKSFPKLFEYAIIPVEKSSSKGWGFLKKFRFPANAAIIADNYILKESKSKQENLFRILEALLPGDLEIDFHLTIFTREVHNLKAEYDQILGFLTEKYSYSVKLSIGLLGLGSLSLHDRDFLTNYCHYRSGAGFDLFKHTGQGIKSKHNTQVYIFPVTYMGNPGGSLSRDSENDSPVQQGYYSLLNQYRRFWEELPERIGNQQVFIGERLNRLLD